MRRALGLLLFVIACDPSGAAAPARFRTVVPAADGAWEVVLAVDGKPEREVPRLRLQADGAEVEATFTAAPDGTLRARVLGVPAPARRLELVLAGKRAETVAALTLAPPSWPNDWTIYHVMVEMFRNGSPGNDDRLSGWKHPRYAGGDLQGVLEKLDHVKALGADALWLSPIFAADTSHGYDVRNYYRIGEAVGVPEDPEAGLALFRRLVREAHARGIKVVLDLPLNHASHRYDMKAGDPGERKPRTTGARQEAEKLWDSWGATYRYWNVEDPGTRRFLLDVALHWLVEEDVDGLRLDYVRGLPHAFWAELRAEVERKKPGALLLGEAWIDAGGAEANAREIATYARVLPSLLDFPMQIAATSVFARGSGGADRLEALLQHEAALYGADAHPAWFLDNHDLARFLSWTGDRDRLVAALGFLASLSGPVVVFYGTETGLAHPSPRDGFLDGGRVPMPWDRLDDALVARVAEVLKARAAHPALRSGGRLPIHADGDVLVMAKIAPGEVALVGVNLSGAPRTVTLPPSPLLGGLRPVLGTSLPSEGGWTLPPTSTTVLARPR